MHKLVSLAALSLALAGCNPAGLVAGIVSNAVGGTPGTAALKFSAAVNTNATTTDFGTGAVFKGESNGATPPTITFGATTVDVFAGNKTRLVTVTISGSKPAAGASYPVASVASAGSGVGAVVSYSEPAVNSTDKIKTWLSTGGTVSVDAVAAGSVSVTLKGCAMSSALAGSSSDNAATGSFTLDGTLKVDGIKGL